MEWRATYLGHPGAEVFEYVRLEETATDDGGNGDADDPAVL